MAKNPDQVSKLSPAANTFAPKSSFIENASYDSQSQKLTLTFKSGSQYAYQNVSPSTWLSFQQAPDHSSFYAKTLKGQSSSSPIRQAIVGQPKSNPLQKIRQERTLQNVHGNTLTSGIKHSERRAGLSGPGTVPASLYSQ